MNNLEVKPSPEVKSLIKNSMPKPGLKYFLYRPWVAVVAVLSVALVVSLIITDNHNSYYPIEYSLQKETPVELSITDNSSAVKGSKIIEFENPNKEVTSSILEYSTYTKEIIIQISDIEEYKTLNGEDYIYFNKNDDNLSINSNVCGRFSILILKEENDLFDTVYLNFLKQPQIFISHDTIVSGNNIILPVLQNEGKWIGKCSDKVKSIGENLFEFVADSYGNYQVIRKESDIVGTYFDTINVSFKPVNEKKIIFEVVHNPVCYGDYAIIKFSSEGIDKSTLYLDKGEIVHKSENEYLLKFDYQGQKEAVCEIISADNYSQTDSIVFVLPSKILPKYTVYNADCDELGRLEIPENSDCRAYYNNIEIGDEGLSELKAGKYRILFVDENSCKQEEFISIENKLILKANFDIQISLDGMSVKTINFTDYPDELYSEIRYKWFVNEVLQSEEEEPILELNAISNSVRLNVSSGEYCSDEYEIENIQLNHDLMRVPNFFTPNGDGKHDEFKVVVDKRLCNFKAIISNRSGQLVYEWENPEIGWDGNLSSGQLASDGLYFYIIQAFDISGKPYEKRGTVQLLRD
jgi:gliding motility-associated-like protein